MIKLIDVCKSYAVKGAPTVKALDHVSIEFGEKGLVFILGKSGSGKSTLLNCIGGLDRIDSGEIIIKGKSSKNFSQSEFDSYRNTYLGFIFQEYNILNEFTVGQNIALAFQLQGKKATPKEVDDILKEVDLEGLSKRKPNELSGGQKQRVAIARALIKNPEVILADEPTGALDSVTGRSVFDTLKKLSKTHLVIVVSHDRDFAELYGDRVVELKDGKLISDISKHQVDPKQISSGVTVVGGKTISIAEGYSLSEKDLKLINEYIKGNKGSTIISMDEKSNENFRTLMKTDKEGKQDVFSDTADEDIGSKQYTEGDFKLIKSRLPFKNSLKMAWTSMKVKPIKLFMTMLLSVVALTLFGLSDTLAGYDKIGAYANSIVDSGATSIAWKKARGTSSGDYVSYSQEQMKEEDVSALSERFGAEYQGVYSYGNSSISYSFFSLFNNTNIGSNSSNYGTYNSNFSGLCGYVGVDETSLAKSKLSLSAGRLPTEDNEVAISLYELGFFKKYGYMTSLGSGGEAISIKAEDLSGDSTGSVFLSKNPYFPKNGSSFEDEYMPLQYVVGIIDTKADLAPYESLDKADSTSSLYMLQSQFNDYIQYGYHGVGFVSPSIIKEKVAIASNGIPTSNYTTGITASFSYKKTENDKTSTYSLSPRVMYDSTLSDNQNDLVLFSTGTSLAEGECAISLNSINECFYSASFGTNPLDAAVSSKWAASYGASQYPFATTVGVDDPSLSIQNCLSLFTINSCGRYVKENGLPSDGSKLSALKKSCDKYYKAYLDTDDYADHDNKSWDDSSYSEAEQLAMLKNYYIYYLSADQIGISTGTGISYIGEGGLNENAFGEKSGYELAIADIKEFTKSDLALIEFPTLDVKVDPYSYSGDKVSIIDGTMNIKGINLSNFGNGNQLFQSGGGIFLSGVDYAKIASAAIGVGGVYSYAVGALPSSKDEVRKLVQYDKDNEKATTRYILETASTSSVSMVNSLVESLKTIFFYVGLALAIFSAFLLATFIGNSVSAKKREIGILRAVGARSSDVYGIFLNESEIIALINSAISIILTVVLCGVINNSIRSSLGLSVSIFNFTWRQLLLVLAIAIGSAAIASFIPSFSISRKKPIDSINNR